MGLTKEKAKENLAKLVEKFERELSSGMANEYNEEATKTSFIQPLLNDVLGWDVADREEVSPEEKVSKGRVDYGLKAEGRIRIFVEAKPIKAELSKHIEQAVRYGYNYRNVPFVLLTDFEGIKLFDVTIKPDLRNPQKGIKLDLSWDEYLRQFEKLWLLSRESVIKGELDKLLVIKPKDRIPVDKAVLDDLNEWREALAKDIFRNNGKMFSTGQLEKDAEYLKEITQKILDRIIFIRSCEDRHLVHQRTLQELFGERDASSGINAMLFLKEEFKQYNIIFDSDLFRPQEWEDGLVIDFKLMQNIILETYNPYQFDVIPLEVLGNIYEQYLGYTIRLTEHQVKYELKPDVRKAGGVYYTPEYIVDYIVRNTVGKLLQELPPAKIKKLRILDPACGSGSFLIRAYEEMLSWYRSQKKQKSAFRERGEELDLRHTESEARLTIHEKSQILRQHIFGVDIDEQAVEVTKLSLMLKMLEGEYGFIPGQALLPLLDQNIRCGNSLISGEVLELKKFFGDEWYKVKPFNWHREFKEIMEKEGGFDAVIGNPPYVFTRNEGFTKGEKDYFYTDFRAQSAQLNTFGLFVERTFSLLKRRGIVGFITPNNWLTIDSFSLLRKFLLKNSSTLSVYNNEEKVFGEANVDTCIFLSEKGNRPEVSLGELKNGEIKFKHIVKNKDIFLLKDIFKIAQFKNVEYSSILQKIETNSVTLKNLAIVSTGLKAYQEGKGIPRQTDKEKKLRVFHSKINKNKTYKRYLNGKDVRRYCLEWSGEYLSYGDHLAEPRKSVPFIGPRILVRQIPSKPPYCINAGFTDEEFLNDINSMVIFNLAKNFSFNFLLALINSRLMSFWFDKTFDKFQRKIFPQFKVKELALFPIHNIDFNNSLKKNLYSKIVALVDVMLNLNKRIQKTKGGEKEQIQRQIEKTDKEIDDIVYKLYRITEEERKIIETNI